MRPGLGCAALALALCAAGMACTGRANPAAGGPEPTAGNEVLADAERAAREGVIEVSIIKLQQYLQSSPDAASRRRAKLLLAEEFLEVRKPNEALAVLADPDLPVQDADFLRARAALRLQRWATADATYARLLQESSDPAFRERARLGLAAAKCGARDLGGALNVLQPLLAGPEGVSQRAILLAAQICIEQSRFADAQAFLERLGPAGAHIQTLQQCLEGELAFQQGRMTDAQQAFTEVANAPAGNTGRSLAIAEFGLSRIELAAQDYEGAEARLEKIIADQPRNPLLLQLFRALYRVYSLEGNASGNDLVAWSKDDPNLAGTDRPAYALFYLGKLAQDQGAAARARAYFEETRQRFPDQTAASLATMELARDDLSAGQAAEAVRLLEGGRAEKLSNDDKTVWHELQAEAYAGAGRFDQARLAYARSLETADGTLRPRILLNMALCALRLRDSRLFASDQEAFLRSNPGPDLLGELEFQKGRLEAALGDAHAEQTLRQFLLRYPNHARVSEAHLILAECAYRTKPVRFTRVIDELKQDQSGDPKLSEQEARLAFFAAADDPQVSLAEVARLAQSFLERYPASPARAEIRLKLGEAYFRASDYANARMQFEQIRDEQPDSPLVESALFLAGEAARRSLNPSSVDEAITLFEEVYKLGGPLRFEARLEQALTKRQVQHENEAITLLDDLLSMNPPIEIRNQALEAKGQAQFALGAQHPEFYAQAERTFRALTGPDNPAEWRQRGLYEAGKCCEKLDRLDDALAAYYDALNVAGTSGDQVWFYRAGFDAAQILEERRAWNSAGAVYEKLANSRGGRAAEAKERLTKLRLEHFLWPD